MSASPSGTLEGKGNSMSLGLQLWPPPLPPWWNMGPALWWKLFWTRVPNGRGCMCTFFIVPLVFVRLSSWACVVQHYVLRVMWLQITQKNYDSSSIFWSPKKRHFDFSSAPFEITARARCRLQIHFVHALLIQEPKKVNTCSFSFFVLIMTLCDNDFY